MKFATNEQLDALTLPFENEVKSPWYRQPSGKEHYRLISYLASERSIAYDIGTFIGYSACAMSTAKEVHSFDIQKRPIEAPKPKNCHYQILNVLETADLFKDDAVILLDTFHQGDFEKAFVDRLIAQNWRGLLVCDDIHLGESMKNFWSNIALEKYDVTSIGHHSGTGIVIFE